MKSVKLVFTLAVLVCLVATTALSGVAGGTKGANTVQSNGQVQVLGLENSDIPADRVQKSSAPIRVDAAQASPQPEQINAAALSKYPTVSAAGLAGTYNIPGDFPDLASAAAVLNFVGLSGDATFVLTGTSYTSGTVTFGGAYPGAGTYGVTITVTLGNAVTFDFNTTATNGKGIVFNGAKNITIDGVADDTTSLTFGIATGAPFPLGDPMGSTIYITGASDEIGVKNATVKGVVNDPVFELQTEGRSCVFVFAATADGGPSTNLEFDNVTFINGTIGLKMFPETPAVTVADLTVNNCKFGGAFGGRLIIGSWLEYGARVTWTNNQVKDLYWLDWYWNNLGTEYVEDVAFGVGNIYYNLGQMTAWHHLAVDHGTYAYNVIDGLSGDVSPGTISYGTRTLGANNGLAAPHEPTLHHNRFSNIFLDHAGQSLTGIRGGTINVYHNSVHLYGTAAYDWPSTCLNGVTVAKNNAFVNEIVNASATSSRGVTAGGIIDYNAIYGADRPTALNPTIAGAVAAGVNPNGVYAKTSFTWDLHGDSTTPTAAENIGAPRVLDAADIDGAPIDTTVAGTRDAGADEFGVTGSLLAADVLPAAIPNVLSGLMISGLSLTPTVTVKNNSNAATGSFNVQLSIAVDGYSDTKSVSLAPGESKAISFATWTPVAIGPRTVTATTLLGGDSVPGNDTLSKSPIIVTGDPVVTPITYTFDAGAQGWTGTNDWVRKAGFSKLGGVFGGSGASWVTERPNDASTYTEGAYATSQGYTATYPGPNTLTSPWLDLSGMSGTDLYVAFWHSISTEAAWDRSWLQYTTDGIAWHDLGVLNDPNGINWYNESLYEHAALDTSLIDLETYSLYGLTPPPASWTSNDNGITGNPGDGVPNGPFGWVLTMLKVSTPAIARAPAIRFRYVAVSDAVTAYGGWAFDNFTLTNIVAGGGGTITGHAWNDVNGNGADDGEADIAAGTKVYRSYYGVPLDSTTLDGSGDYTFSSVLIPGIYNVHLGVTGVGFTVPYGVTGTADVFHPADFSVKVQDFGTFAGSISGKKYSDVNDNGTNDAEPGLSGWTIEVHADSTDGTLIASAVTNGTGNYSFAVPPGTFSLVEVPDPDVARQTGPVGGSYTVVISSGSPTSANNDFGNFLLGRFRIQLNVDQNGNGVKDAGDILAVPSGASSSFKITKDGVPLDPDSVFTLGNGIISAQYTGLDTGTYVVTELDSIPGWRRTLGGVNSLVVNESGESDTAYYLDFKYLVITGKKYNDLNGNGAKDLGEPGLAGWTINVSGGVYYGGTSAVTDTNGDYTIDSVFNGAHTVAEVAQAGWTLTAPTGGTYAITGNSGNLVNTTGKDFGNFDNADVSGIVYRDYNGNGVMDPGDSPYSGVTVSLAVNGGSDVSDGTGYSFSGVIATDTIRITAPLGFVVTQPAAGEYPLALISGGAAANMHFGIFQNSDSSTKYRTFTADQLGADDQKKPGKTPKAGKAYDPVKNKPNMANLVDVLINPKTGKAIGSIQVGIPAQNNLGGKEKAYVKPNKQTSFWASLNNKSVHHTGMARGFDQDLKGKPILKLQKAFAPNKKQNNKLFAELLTLKLNLVASQYLQTPSGLGVLLYNDANSSLDGMTLDEIADYADTVMTNFEFVPLGVYTELDTVVAKINGAFYNSATDDTSTGWAGPKLAWKAYKSVSEVSFLKANPGATPKQRVGTPGEQVPTEFALAQNYPNPFNPTTTIEFDVPEASLVTLKVYNLLGQEVMTLLNREEVEFGDAVEFDASSLPSGVYLYRIVAETIADAEAGIAAETFTQVKKMVLVK